MFQCFDGPGSRNRANDECYADGRGEPRRQGLDCQPCPETVTVACNSAKTCDAVLTDEIVDFGALGKCCAVVAASATGVTGSGPFLGEPGRQVLQIGAHVGRRSFVAPNLPSRV